VDLGFRLFRLRQPAEARFNSLQIYFVLISLESVFYVSREGDEREIFTGYKNYNLNMVGAKAVHYCFKKNDQLYFPIFQVRLIINTDCQLFGSQRLSFNVAIIFQ
jgi:hypothetical protein